MRGVIKTSPSRSLGKWMRQTEVNLIRGHVVKPLMRALAVVQLPEHCPIFGVHRKKGFDHFLDENGLALKNIEKLTDKL
jgi:hypothetical protein